MDVDAIVNAWVAPVADAIASVELSQVINLVDSLNFCMAIPNLIAVYLLLPELRADLRVYQRRYLDAGARA
jgi:AGCS family alanine or glycine:cation symporter